MTNYIEWKGKDSRDIAGLIICELPAVSKPPMRTAETTVDGVDGSLIEELGYDPYDKTLTVGLTSKADTDEVIKYFSGTGKVTFSNEPYKYYNAVIVGQIDYTRLVRFKTATVTMRVQPYKYSTVENPVTTGTKTVTANPLITNGTLSDGTAVTVEDGGEGRKIIAAYVDAKQNQHYSLTGTLVPEGGQTNVYCYDENKTLIEQLHAQQNDGKFEFTTLPDTKYIRFDGTAADIDISTVSLAEQTQETTYLVSNTGTEKSKPIIMLQGEGAIECAVNDTPVFTYTFDRAHYKVYIDSEKQDAYLENVLKNRNMNGEFPVLNAGSNKISFTGYLTSAEIKARSRWL